MIKMRLSLELNVAESFHICLNPKFPREEDGKFKKQNFKVEILKKNKFTHCLYPIEFIFIS